MAKNPEVFPGKSFQDTLKDIYDNSTAKRTQIEAIMTTLVNLIQGSAQNAAVVAPLMKELLEVSVKNDEHIVKVATIIQRLISSEIQMQGEGMETLLTDDEKNKLLIESEQESIKELAETLKETDTIKSIAQSAGQLTSGSTP